MGYVSRLAGVARATLCVISTLFMGSTGCSAQGEDLGEAEQAFSQYTCPAAGAPGFTTVPYAAAEYLEGYVDQLSYASTDTIHVYVSGALSGNAYPSVTATYWRLDASKPTTNPGELITTLSGVVTAQQIPVDASHCGARWNETPSFSLTGSQRSSLGFTSGLYAIQLQFYGLSMSGFTKQQIFAHRFWIPFVVRAADPNSSAIAVISATNTWSAYNPWPATSVGATAANMTTDAFTGAPAFNGSFKSGHSYYFPDSPGPWGACVPSSTSATGPLYNYPAGSPPSPSNAPNGGDQWYDSPWCGSDSSGTWGNIVNFLRPNPIADPGVEMSYYDLQCGTDNCGGRGGFGALHTVPAEREGLDWLRRQAAADPTLSYSMLADSDSATVNALDATKVHTLIVQGHNEYWTDAMRTAVDAYVRRGGHLLKTSGDTANWQVDYIGDQPPCSTPGCGQMRTRKADEPRAHFITAELAGRCI